MSNTQPGDNKKTPLAQQEEKTLAFWRDKEIFEKSLEKKAPKGNFVFYDGPPFATGLPHYGHLLASTIKDVVPRYKTMRGYNVQRVWGWDCHGMPIETLIEKEFNLKSKNDIEEFGVGKFNEAARHSVLKYDTEWKKTIPRLGRFVNMDRGYKTMDWKYMESVWWAFKQLHSKGYIYEGYKAMHICPRCETTLSVSDVATGGYKPLTDISVVVKFELVDEPGTFVLVWTTTPWTLPGNVSLAVGENIEYAKISVTDDAGKKEYYILAKDRLVDMVTQEHELVGMVKGKELVGKSYKPVFDYYQKTNIENKANGWKIYPAAFVATDTGTGIVHVAPAFGEDDLEVGRVRSLPFVQHVTMAGIMKDEVVDFAGLQVKPKDNHQATDIEIIKYLAHNNLLFKKEKIVHAYPHCWRCDTPLLNYATSSWFVNVIGMKDKLIAVNKKIKWIPDHIGSGRFGKWLEGARDWAFSRSRYWGAPVPFWKCEECEVMEVVGSIDELKKKSKPANNTYFTVRHGQAVSNATNTVNSRIDDKYSLTEIGKVQALKTGKSLKDKGINIIISSPLPRTKQTANIIATEVGVDKKDIIFDERIREIGMGEFEGQSVENYHNFFSPWYEKFEKAPQGGENLVQVRERVMQFLYETDKKYLGKTILIVTHANPTWMLHAGAAAFDKEGAIEMRSGKDVLVKTGEARALNFVPLPHNNSFEIDLHRPYIDDVELVCACGGTMKRILEVFDCWAESSSMPFARLHYPFENKKEFKENFPADFIAEGQDQTRGWFYHMLVLSVGLFDKAAYKQVIVNGLVLAEDGQKMSKRLKNYPDVNYIMNTYGSDALRYYMLSSPIVRAEDLDFSEKGVREVQNKLITRLRNVASFYELYKGDVTEKITWTSSSNALDVWVRVRLMELVASVSSGLDKYELDKASRPLIDFVDDLSTWYIRRSRDRFKGDDKDDKNNAIATTRFILFELSKILAPFTPFIAEEIYQQVKSKDDKESVHLESWTKISFDIPVWPNPMAIFHRMWGTHKELNVLTHMQRVRELVSLALEARAKEGIKVRQPLGALWVKNCEVKIADNQDFIDLIKDEVNVKEIFFGWEMDEDVLLDTHITQELKQEGQIRELVRYIQELRKTAKLEPSDKASLTIKTSAQGEALVKIFEDEIRKTAVLKTIIFDSFVDGEEVKVGNMVFTLNINT